MKIVITFVEDKHLAKYGRISLSGTHYTGTPRSGILVERLVADCKLYMALEVSRLGKGSR